MNRKEIMQYVRDIESKVDHVLSEYSSGMGCPCNYEPFVYWAGKRQGPGWQDSIQNQLVKSTLKLDCFERTDDHEGSMEYSGTWVCSNCETVWDHFSYEWRMLAFRERLLKFGEEVPDELNEGLIGASIFATLGHEPHGRATISLDQWVAFMLGRDFESEIYRSFEPPHGSGNRSTDE
jgi:hypothetical protein